jgi:hypothetical protein
MPWELCNATVMYSEMEMDLRVLKNETYMAFEIAEICLSLPIGFRSV